MMDTARAAALHAVLDLPGPPPRSGDPLPPFAHQIYFWDALPPVALGRDGHPRIGDFIPDLGLSRRMWAGGRLEFTRDLRAGLPARKTTVIEDVARKRGRSGPLGFVTLRHEVSQDGALCATEWQDLVYRADPDPGAPTPIPPQAPVAEHRAPVSFDPVVLFRYSALTFNGHRIHYDRDYAQSVEGYGGLVVHGPLLAQRLMLLAQDRLGPLRRFRFRGTAPLIDTEDAALCQSGNAFWVEGPDNRLCMTAEAEAA
ncbi:FAS1-like dehydratase domain-containing protein [Actibacterium ureilyticum]|uniref:FAS1-like dehydratase domain-containing protein n=1 Tax=Actibacterium ureilyticum TaxID=1590614 RepID=UPI000BAB21BA